MFVSLD